MSDWIDTAFLWIYDIVAIYYVVRLIIDCNREERQLSE